MRIGELASTTGIAPASIRFYEAEGLLSPPARTGSNYRDYANEYVERLLFIRRCRSLDMELEEIRALLRFKDAPGDDCAGVNRLLDEHIGHVGGRVLELRALKAQLRTLRRQCEQVQETQRCGILRELSNRAAPRPPRAGRHVRGVHR